MKNADLSLIPIAFSALLYSNIVEPSKDFNNEINSELTLTRNIITEYGYWFNIRFVGAY